MSGTDITKRVIHQFSSRREELLRPAGETGDATPANELLRATASDPSRLSDSQTPAIAQDEIVEISQK